MSVGNVSRYMVLFAILIVSGCAALPENRAFNAADNLELKKVVVLPMRESEVDLMILNNPGFSFGLIGIGLAEANRVPKRNWLREQASSVEFDHLSLFKQQLSEDMAVRGFELIWPERLGDPAKTRTPRLANGMRKSYAPITGGDAQLDVNFGFVGYAAAGSGDSAPYRPTMTVFARLISEDGTQVLFSDQVIYNNVFGLKSGGIVLNPDPGYRYPDFDDMKAAGTQVVQGMEIAVDATAEALANQFGTVQ